MEPECTGPEGAGVPIIDPEHLSAMTGADVPLAIEIIEIFRQQTELWARMLDASTPPEQWADAAHSLKGTALSVGAGRLAETCAIAEQLGRRHADEPVSTAQAGLALADVRNEIGPAIEASAKLAYQLSLSGRFSLS